MSPTFCRRQSSHKGRNVMNQQQYRLLCMDIDGTLLNSAHKLPLANREAVQSAAKNGVTICLMSARPPRAVFSDSGCARRGWTAGVLRRRTYSLGRKPAGGQPPDPRMCAGCPAGNTGERYPLERLPRPRLAHCRRGRVEPCRGADNRRTADRRAVGDSVCRLGRRRRAQTALHGREIAD